MKQFAFLVALCWLCSCNSLHVAQNKNLSNTPSIGIEWNFGDIPNQQLQRRIDSVILAEIDRFNSQKHAFTVHEKKRRDKTKDYVTIDIEKGKVVGSGGKAAGYIITALGIATPIVLAVVESPVIFSFYYWPYHTIHSKVTLSPNLSDERKNNKNLAAMTGALFAATDKQVDKLIRKYAEALHKTLLDIETQLGQNK